MRKFSLSHFLNYFYCQIYAGLVSWAVFPLSYVIELASKTSGPWCFLVRKFILFFFYLFFLRAASLLRHNTIKFAHLKCTIECFSCIFIELYDHYHSWLEHFYHTTKKLHYPLFSISPTPTSSPRQPLIYFLPFLIRLFYIYHINRIVDYVVSLFLVLSFSIMFARFVHGVACIST